MYDGTCYIYYIKTRAAKGAPEYLMKRTTSSINSAMSRLGTILRLLNFWVLPPSALYLTAVVVDLFKTSRMIYSISQYDEI